TFHDARGRKVNLATGANASLVVASPALFEALDNLSAHAASMFLQLEAPEALPATRDAIDGARELMRRIETRYYSWVVSCRSRTPRRPSPSSGSSARSASCWTW